MYPPSVPRSGCVVTHLLLPARESGCSRDCKGWFSRYQTQWKYKKLRNSIRVSVNANKVGLIFMCVNSFAWCLPRKKIAAPMFFISCGVGHSKNRQMVAGMATRGCVHRCRARRDGVIRNVVGEVGGDVDYQDLSREQLINLLVKRDAKRKLGLVWERDVIAADTALNGDFVVMDTDAEASYGLSPHSNLIIEGDNFDALRWLRMTHSGRVKLILIDPPYNTGNKDWVYNDAFRGKDERWKHSTWLEFMFRRLTLARDLLRPDGAIMVTINDEGRAKLEMMMDEVFPNMRVGSMVWRTKDTANDTTGSNFSAVHEHVLVYGGSGFRFCGDPLDMSDYSNRDQDRRGLWTPDPLTKAHTLTDRPNTYYPVQNPVTGLWYPCSPDRVWAYASKHRLREGQTLRAMTMEAMVADNRIWFPEETSPPFFFATAADLKTAIADGAVPRDGNGHPLLRPDLPDLDFWIGKQIAHGRPSKKSFWEERKNRANPTKPVCSMIVGTNDTPVDGEVVELVSEKQGKGTDRLKLLLGTKAFDYPKPVSLFKSLVSVAAGTEGIVLDFFAGSGTTAEAVLALNAEDGGDRRFILVSSTERTADAPDRNLCRDVCAQRVRRFADGVDGEGSVDDSFGYLVADRVDFTDLSYTLTATRILTTVQAMHGLPVGGEPDDSGVWSAVTVEGVAVAYCDRFSDEAADSLRRAVEGHPAVVYAYAPGAVRDLFAGNQAVEVRAVTDEFLRRFGS